MQKLNFYKLRAKVICEDLSEVLGVMAVWDGSGETEYGLMLSPIRGCRRSASASCCRRISPRRPRPISAPS